MLNKIQFKRTLLFPLKQKLWFGKNVKVKIYHSILFGLTRGTYLTPRIGFGSKTFPNSSNLEFKKIKFKHLCQFEAKLDLHKVLPRE
jgi:hypothetical protein